MSTNTKGNINTGKISMALIFFLLSVDSNIGASGSSSPGQADRLDQSQHNTLKTMLTTGQIPKSSLNSLSLLTGVSFSQSGMKNSLFDEGLRIAQQYGLGDFAQEIKTLQGGSPKSEAKDTNDGETEDRTDQNSTGNESDSTGQNGNHQGVDSDSDSVKQESVHTEKRKLPCSDSTEDAS